MKPIRLNHLKRLLVSGAVLSCFTAGQLLAATVTVLNEDFESYTGPATSLADESDADPVSLEINIADDNPVTGAGAAGSGVQLQDWQVHAGTNALLLRPGSEAQIYLNNIISGSRYQFDFWIYSTRDVTSTHNFYIILRGEGSDFNGDDYLAYRSDRVANSTALYYYDGVGPGTAAWTAVGTNHTVNQWQHHRIVFDPNAQTFSLYLDDMDTPVLTGGDLSRSQVAAPTLLRIINEGNSADDGYFAIDDISLTADDGITLTTTFTEGFESYPARVASDDDADPQGPWITTEMDGTAGTTAPRAPAKVQVVDNTVVQPHSGTKCLKIEAGQRAGSTVAWGVPPQSDVQITWWAKVPATLTGGEYNYLRMSLYGSEGGSSYAGDSALLGYGCRSATVGDSTSLTYYITGPAWVDSGIDFTPDTWEQYRLTTHNALGQYTIIKNPSSANPEVIADRQPMIGSAGSWGPTFMAAWSSSNGTNHPPVYIDDIEIKSLVSNPNPLPIPYTVQIESTRFTNSTVLPLSGPIGAAVVDPRDNSTIVFTVDAGTGGGIYKATKVASGNWAVDPTPLVSGLSNPSGLAIQTDGTLWWTHDFTTAIMRLKWPWTENTPEMVIADFILPGATTTTFADDDPFDVCVPPNDFNGSIGSSNLLVVMDRGVDANANNALFLVDPATMEIGQTNYETYLLGPSTTLLGGADLVALAPLLSTEVATLCLDGQVTAVDANGLSRSFWPDFYSDPFVPIQPAAMSVDPDTGRLWIADDLTNEVWSCATDGTAGAREVTFPLTNLERPDYQIDFAEPGMSFAKDGSILVISDSSAANGGGRLIILHNEAFAVPTFAITSYTKTETGFEINWQSAGSVKYRVQRTTDLGTPMVDISGDLTGTSFTDTNMPNGAFYRVVAAP